MALYGAVSLTDKEGVFLGSVNIDNLNATAGDILYSANGFDIDGLSLGDGLQIDSGALKTIGNPAIQLTSNSIYVNDGESGIQSAIDSVSQADTIFISSGSYGESAVSITNKYNISLINPCCNQGTICEVLNGLTVDGTSELIRVSNLQIKGTSVVLKGVGRHIFNNLNFTGLSIPVPLNVEIGKNSTKYMTFTNCSFNQYVSIVISDLFSSVVYFINCDFGGCTIQLNNASPLQVIYNNCAGFTALPSTSKATFIGLNVLASGASQVNTVDLKTTLINGVAPVTIASQANTRIPFETATTNALSSSSNLTFNSGTNTLAVPNASIGAISGVSTINGSAYPPASGGLSASGQSNTRIPYCTATTDSLKCEDGFAYNDSTNRLLVEGITATDIQTSSLGTDGLTVNTINGSAYAPGVSISSQAETQIPYCTATPNVLSSDVNFTYNSSSGLLSAPSINCTELNGGTPSNLTMINQTEGRIAYCTSTTDVIKGNDNFKYDEATNTLAITNPFHINIDGVQPESNFALCSDGAGGGMKYVRIIDTGFRYVANFSGQQTVKSANPVTLYGNGVANIVPNLTTYFNCIFNVHITGGADVLTLELYNAETSAVVQTYKFRVLAGENTIPVQFAYNFGATYTIDFLINASLTTHNIETDTNCYYNVSISQLVS